MKEKMIWLSYPVSPNDPRPPAIPQPELKVFLTIAKDGANVQVLKIASHTGTHLDTPFHVVSYGIGLNNYSPEEFLFERPIIVDLQIKDSKIIMPEDIKKFKKILNKADIALFRFNRGKIRKSDPKRFSLHSPGFGIESAEWIRKNCKNLRAIGMDVPSLACIDYLDETMEAHNILLGGKGNRFIVIEDMNLEKNISGLKKIHIWPWFVKGMDSSPCAVVGVIKK
jgi:arylformamidase